jgi:hypothetical protein
MTSFNFTDSQYRFTSPIRFFKANDPFYFEVDNIPLKQLQENDLWLKDQIRNVLNRTSASGSGSGGSTTTFNGSVNRSGISELQAYLDDDQSTIKVRPGRFTARINDATVINPLSRLLKAYMAGENEYSNENSWGVLPFSVADVKNKFKQAVALNLNGLSERTFTWSKYAPNVTYGESIPRIENSQIKFKLLKPNYIFNPGYPAIGATLFQTSGSESNPSQFPNFYIDSYSYLSKGFGELPSLENQFIKAWRGIFRTAIVDVPDELSVNLRPFDPADHFYYDEDGQKIETNANLRIDLIFAYSKPIDTSSVKIQKLVSNDAQTITKCELGIIHGAGLGASFSRESRSERAKDSFPENVLVENVANSFHINPDKSTFADGTPKMLSHFGDESAINTGFKIGENNYIRGSFPSPDDIMNLSPYLDIDSRRPWEPVIGSPTNSSTLVLVGQSILPIAYVVVRKDAPRNSTGNAQINPEDIIDIRPLLRTTELTYNERAGIAAASPSISLANPVVSKSEMLYWLDEFKRIELGATITSISETPRIVARGRIHGGLYYGVEGVLRSMIKARVPNANEDFIKDEIRNRYGYVGRNQSSSFRIPSLPDWDKAEWGITLNDPLFGEYPNDRINYHVFGGYAQGYTSNAASGNPSVYEHAAFADINRTTQIKRLSVHKSTNTPSNSWARGQSPNTLAEIDGKTTIYFVKKKINVTLNQQIFSDYDVNVELLNCIPLSQGGADANDIQVGSTAGIWVEKNRDYFTIFVSWVAKTPLQSNPNISETNSLTTYPSTPRLNRNAGNDFAGFAVINDELSKKQHWQSRSVSNWAGESSIGVAIYPTVQFEVMGIPVGFEGNLVETDLSQTPTITIG